MSKPEPIGGYFSLELNDRGCPYPEAIALNSATHALFYVLKARRYRKLYLPYYVCDYVVYPLKELDIDYEFYHIDQHLEIASLPTVGSDEALLYVNYFGLKEPYLTRLAALAQNVIIDNSQAFYSNPRRELFGQCDAMNSCRKYFGVADGAYLMTDCRLDEELHQGTSHERMTHLLKRIDLSPQAGYQDFQDAEDQLHSEPLSQMSRLTAAMMNSIDYADAAKRRRQNFEHLDRVLGNRNKFSWTLTDAMVPLVYPLWVDDGEQLRQRLINQQIFCARYWPNVLEWCQPDDLEARLTLQTVCLPIDQRYGTAEMDRILQVIGG